MNIVSWINGDDVFNELLYFNSFTSINIIKIMEEDLTCPLCFKILYIPVSTSCGHTYCKSCIERSFHNSKQCPICRVTLASPLNLTPTFILQTIIEKKYPEETKKRKQEEQIEERQRKQKSTTLPVIFVKDLIAFPGEISLVHISEDRFLSLMEVLNENQKVFAFVSKFNGLFLIWATAVNSIYQVPGGRVISGKCLARLAPVIIRRIEEPHYSINIEEISDQQLMDNSLFEVPNVKLNDLVIRDNSQLERELLSFTEACISNLTQTELNLVRQRSPSSMKPSFFMLSILKLNLNDLAFCFMSRDDTERLMVIKKYVETKTPCRLLIKHSKAASPSLVYGGVLLILFLLFISKLMS